MQDEDGSIQWPTEDAMDVESEIGGVSTDDLAGPSLGNGRPSFGSKRLSYPGSSLEQPLLARRFSTTSRSQAQETDDRYSQRIYIESEDLTAVFTGFSTSTGGVILYVSLCIATFGLAYLFFRWLPRWRIRLIGRPTPFWKCQWITVEVSRKFLIANAFHLT